MDERESIPAAQYLRMSTEHQQYSMENQSAVIEKYAEAHGFEIVRTYHDAAKSGVSLRHRNGLQSLLRDVVGRSPSFRAILVYDVSRWGRFQDTDESAHYEFLCKSAGVPVHYCAEVFANDSSLPNLIMKAIKRTMAGEYSRELGVKVLAGLKRLTAKGFKPGGPPGYGLRRMLLSAEGKPKQELAPGERKSITTDRVILVPGPPHEVACVREIYRMLISEKLRVRAIARDLSRRGIPYLGNSKWSYAAVHSILTKPKYAGYNVFGRTSCKLHTPSIKLPKSEWIVTPNAFLPLVAPETFESAQEILHARTITLTNEAIVAQLRRVLTAKGKLSCAIIKNSPGLPSLSTLRDRFGSLRSAYKRAGYGDLNGAASMVTRRRIELLREALISNILDLFPNKLSIVQQTGKWRKKIRLSNGRIVSVLIARAWRGSTGAIRWTIAPVWHERKFVTLLTRLDQQNSSFMDFHVLPNIVPCKRIRISLTDPWLHRGRRLRAFKDFYAVVQRVARKK